MKNAILAMLLLLPFVICAQNEPQQDRNAFYQSIDVTTYQGGKFKFTAYIRTENCENKSSARIWARVDTKKSISFFDNMDNRPVTSNAWAKYTIEGSIDSKALKLLVGGLYFGNGRYYYDDFVLQIQKQGGEWEEFPLKNPSFETDSFKLDWKSFYKVKGYTDFLSNENVVHGSKCLVVDGAGSMIGKYMQANGINIYYEEYGKGDTLLLLHGNGESLQSFSKQIPELSKHFFVIAIDSRGQGKTNHDGQKMTYELMAEDVLAFLNARQISKTHILGWSDGGNIGLILAMKHPARVNKLAVMGANLYNDKTSVDEKINKQLRALRANLVKQQSEQNAFRIQMLDMLLNEPNIAPEKLSAISATTLVMAGSKDVIKEEHTKLIASKIPNAKLVIFEKGTHYEPVENPERFNETVILFFLGK